MTRKLDKEHLDELQNQITKLQMEREYNIT